MLRLWSHLIHKTELHFRQSLPNPAIHEKKTGGNRVQKAKPLRMSVASSSSSFACIKFRSPSLPPSSSPSSSSSSSSSISSSTFRFSTAKSTVLTIRSSQSEGPLRRPVAPPPSHVKPIPPLPILPTPAPGAVSPPPEPSAPSKPVAVAAMDDKNVITLEFQRQKAKELKEYFKQKKLEETDQGPFFGFIGKNEIANGRWAMFGFAVGMLTEYATGADLVDQVEQIHKIFKLCGNPSDDFWKKAKVGTTFRPPQYYRPRLGEAFRHLPATSVSLLTSLLVLDPASQGSAALALQNEFFYTHPLACGLSGLPVIPKADDEAALKTERRRNDAAADGDDCILRDLVIENSA